ncbi:hypothetical protein NKR19_g866 [Coniochaeta hoffmannii]|uniref:Uncharacterized protein n=1 Tax=Coniochaeta hoffmannii TaxID=91930 RepID=A0AA38SLK3_9PEZI|nr:hypothetical protein NKR19_g866 [Coniochaeta hoffmannii]
MGSQDEIDPVARFMLDPDYNRTVALLYAGSASTPRRLPLAGLGGHGLHLWDNTDAAAYASTEYPSYTTLSAGAQPSSIYADDYDDDDISTPADFMRVPARAGASQTALYRAQSTNSSDASSVAPSIFTRAPATTSSGLSSLPPRHMNFNQTLVAMAANDYGPIGNNQPIAEATTSFPLWCELCVLRDCPVTFPIDQTQEWIEHHCRHLQEQYPSRLMCWFCDHVPFVSARDGRYGNFRDRMEHIREHISSDYMRMDDMRPDFYMINHLGERGIIDAAMRDIALKFSELPAALRLPGSGAHGDAQSHDPQRRQPGRSLAFDLDRERRHQRPRGGERHRHPAPVRHG